MERCSGWAPGVHRFGRALEQGPGCIRASCGLARRGARVDRIGLSDRMNKPTTSYAAGDPESNSDPIMVCGVPRSGVRLVAALLDAQPALASGPELPFILTMAQQWRDIQRTLGANHERHYGLTPAQVRDAFSASILGLVEQRLRHAGKQRFVFQSFGMLLLLDVFAELFPRAKFLFCMRDPRDLVCSLLSCGWRNPRDGSALPYTVDFSLAAR